jgi:hypothetical protein
VIIESSKPSGPGAARDAAGPRLVKSCLGAWGVGRVLGSALRCHKLHSGRCRDWPGNPHTFSDVAQRMWACGGAMCLTGATVLCVHSMGDVLGEGCSLQASVGNIVAIVVSPSPGIFCCHVSMCGWSLLGRCPASGWGPWVVFPVVLVGSGVE